MRIILTSDLHYDVQRSKGPTEAIARRIVEAGGDLLVLVGDSASTDLSILERVFGLFDSFGGRKLFTPGNHEMWVPKGGDSLLRYEEELGSVCAAHGVHYLDAAPFYANGVAVVGSVGWYDYSYRSAALKLPLRFYEAKVAPGRAEADEHYRHLIDGYDDVPPGATDIIVRWMDGVRAKLGMSDVEFTRMLLERLRLQLEEASKRAARIVVAIHHVPFEELVPRPHVVNFAFASAFMGSELFGALIEEYPQVRDVYCGHAHRRKQVRRGALTATCIGSTYTEKVFDVLDVE